jgi:hypothetical protein
MKKLYSTNMKDSFEKNDYFNSTNIIRAFISREFYNLENEKSLII